MNKFSLVKLYDLNIKPLTEKDLKYRDNLINNNDYRDPIFDLAKEFASYDEIIIASPYWDLSFPSILKVYFENISISGLTVKNDKDFVKGLAKAKKIKYISTSGGKIYGANLGFDYVKATGNFFGIKETINFTVEELDIDPSKEKQILDLSIKKISELNE
jgi:FMN-dependent NADH-azoreductase